MFVELLTVAGGGAWERLGRAAEGGTPVRVSVASVDDARATVAARGVTGTIPVEELPYLRGAPLASLAGRAVRGLVVTARPEDGVLVVSPRALACARLEQRRARGRRARVRVVASGEHGVLADAGGLRAWFPPEDPPRRTLGGHAGWVTALTPHLAYLGGAQRRPAASGALTAAIEGTVLAVDEEAARVRLAGASSGATTAIVPRSEIAWHPVPSAADELHAGDRVRGCVVDLGVDGPILSLRAVAPSPWPAIALELPPGTAVRLRVRSVGERGALARLVEQPHVATLVPRADFEPGQALTATVERVDVELGRLHLEGVTPARAG